MKKLYFSLYSYIHGCCIVALLVIKSPVSPSDTKHRVSWVYMVNNMLLLEKKFGFSTPEVDYSKIRSNQKEIFQQMLRLFGTEKRRKLGIDITRCHKHCRVTVFL